MNLIVHNVNYIVDKLLQFVTIILGERLMQTIKITKERAEEISSQILGLMKREKCSVSELNRLLGLTSSRQNLHKKIKSGTLRYFEVLDIFDKLGYEVVIRKK